MINLQVKLTPYNIIYLAHARPKHVVHATSTRTIVAIWEWGSQQ